jgi:hypothetical protein
MRKPKSTIDIRPQLLQSTVLTFKDININSLIVNQAEYQATFAKFNDVVFTDAVIFDGTNLSYGIYFDSCSFEDIVVFNNIIADKYSLSYNQDSESIVFKNCTFTEDFKIIGNETVIDRSLVFNGCSFGKRVSIENINILIEGLSIESCSINSIDIFDCVIKQSIRINSCKINSHIRLHGNNCSSIVFTKSNEFKGNLHIDNCKAKDGVVFNDGIFKEDIYFSLVETIRFGLTIFDSIFEKSFIINYHAGTVKPATGISSFYISSSRFINGLYIKGIQDFAADIPQVKTITLDISPTLSGTILFEDLDIGVLDISGYNIQSKITFKHVLFNQVKMKGFINESGLIFSDVRASYNEWKYESEPFHVRINAIYIDDSNFGKAQFFQTNFKSFDKIVLHNVIINEISTSLVTWFTPLQLEGGEVRNFSDSYKKAKKANDVKGVKNLGVLLIRVLNSKKDIYRQLKIAAQKQGDMPLALEFQRHEMNYYRQIVSIDKPRKWSEHIILTTSLSNNFGQSWLRAFGLLILFSFISYIPIAFLTSSELDYSKFAISFDDVLYNFKVVFYYNIKSWMVILNPAHRTVDIDKNLEKYSGMVYFWDLLSRVVVAYFLFQMVSAFRKFSK